MNLLAFLFIAAVVFGRHEAVLEAHAKSLGLLAPPDARPTTPHPRTMRPPPMPCSPDGPASRSPLAHEAPVETRGDRPASLPPATAGDDAEEEATMVFDPKKHPAIPAVACGDEVHGRA